MQEIAAQAAKPGNRGDLLLRLLHGRRLEGFERSFKLADGTLLSNRYLVGIQKSEIVPASLFDICARIGMPEEYLAAFKENLPDASTIHFGFEDAEPGGICKVYLEFAQRLDRPLAGSGGVAGAFLLHIAYKWDVLDPAQCTIARYHCYPGLSMEATLMRLADIYSGHQDRTSFEVAGSIIDLAAGRCREGLMYLEVSEENNPRASFDINVHEAGVRLIEIEDLLARMRDHYSIPADQFMRFYDRVKPEKLGHISGGINREGRDFLTIYYEVGTR